MFILLLAEYARHNLSNGLQKNHKATYSMLIFVEPTSTIGGHRRKYGNTKMFVLNENQLNIL